jgi:hypothetical protein
MSASSSTRSLTAKIAAALYPSSDISNEDFTKTVLPKNFFDAAIGNPPFAAIAVRSDPEYRQNRFSLHDYFFAKSIDRVRPGGLLVFITSRYSMDKRDDKARTYLTERADLLGAMRLPQTAFKENAGTEVVTDVIFLKQREDGAAPAGEPSRDAETIRVGGQPVEINQYFARHPRDGAGRASPRPRHVLAERIRGAAEGPATSRSTSPRR